MRNRLTKLERASEKLGGGWCCPRCGARPGAAGEVPLIVFADEPGNLAPYGPDCRCSACGAPAPAPVVLSPWPGEAIALLDQLMAERPDLGPLHRKLLRFEVLTLPDEAADTAAERQSC